MKKIFLAGGDGYDLKQIFENAHGVYEIVAGKAAAIDGIKADGAMVGYNPKITDIGSILTAFFNAVGPYSANNSETILYVFYADGEDLPQIEYYVNFLQCRGSEPAAALGTLIVNDSMNPEHEHGKPRVEYKRLKDFKPES